jgi:hypothetical protein
MRSKHIYCLLNLTGKEGATRLAALWLGCLQSGVGRPPWRVSFHNEPLQDEPTLDL